MNKHIRRILLLLSALLASVLVAAPAQAGVQVLQGFTIDNIVACTTGISITYSYQPSGTPTSFVWVYVYYSTNIPANSRVYEQIMPVPVGTGITVNYTYSTPETVGHLLEVYISNPADGTVYAQPQVQNCVTPTPPPSTAPSGPQFCATDGRLDPEDCSTPVALYLTQDADGWMLQVWGIDDATSTGFFLMNLFQEDVPAPGDVPILLESKNGISLYLLPTGEFQVNAPYPKEPSKYYVFIFTIPGGDGYRADFKL